MHRLLRRLFTKTPVKKAPIFIAPDYKSMYELTLEGVLPVFGEIQTGLEVVERYGEMVFRTYDSMGTCTSRLVFYLQNSIDQRRLGIYFPRNPSRDAVELQRQITLCLKEGLGRFKMEATTGEWPPIIDPCAEDSSAKTAHSSVR